MMWRMTGLPCSIEPVRMPALCKLQQSRARTATPHGEYQHLMIIFAMLQARNEAAQRAAPVEIPCWVPESYSVTHPCFKLVRNSWLTACRPVPISY